MNLEDAAGQRLILNLHLDVTVGSEQYGIGSGSVWCDIVEVFRSLACDRGSVQDVVGVADGTLRLDTKLGRSARVGNGVAGLHDAIPKHRSGRQGNAKIVPANIAAVVGKCPSHDNIAVGLPYLVIGVVDPHALRLLFVATGAVVSRGGKRAGIGDALVNAMRDCSRKHVMLLSCRRYVWMYGLHRL